MLSKINRLKSDKDFKNVFRNGRTLENRFFRLKFLKNRKNHSRFGFVIGAKLIKKAASRNILKRRLRAASRFFIDDLKSGFDVVVWPKATSINLGYKDLNDKFKELIILAERLSAVKK